MFILLLWFEPQISLSSLLTLARWFRQNVVERKTWDPAAMRPGGVMPHAQSMDITNQIWGCGILMDMIYIYIYVHVVIQMGVISGKNELIDSDYWIVTCLGPHTKCFHVVSFFHREMNESSSSKDLILWQFAKIGFPPCPSWLQSGLEKEADPPQKPQGIHPFPTV